MKESCPVSETKPETAVENPNTGWYGIFYYNPNNPRVWVPKRNRLGLSWGWTFNFARPMSYAILAALFLLPAVIVACVVASK
jgi:uncharacterized membrane protein